MMMLYKLAGHDPVPVENVEEWGSVFEGDRRIARDEFTTAEGETILVSTVFLAVDHGLGLESKPVLFETMVFGGPLNNKMWRFHTWDEAMEGHARAVHISQEYGATLKGRSATRFRV